MTNNHNKLSAIEYELGTQKLSYKEANGYSDCNMPDIPDVWGWGNFYAASSNFYDLQLGAVRKTLASSSVPLSAIGLVIVCSASFPSESVESVEFTRRLLSDTGLSHANIFGLTLNGCTSLLSAIGVADALVAHGQYSNVLIISADQVPEGAQRFYSYGIFSDSAVSCIVGNGNSSEGLDIVTNLTLSDVASMSGDSPFSAELALNANKTILQNASLSIDAVSKVFCNNLFLPIMSVKEQEAGFVGAQLYIDNIKDKAHCFSADVLINLRDYQKHMVSNDHYMLASDSPGSRSNLLLKYA